MTWKMFTLGFIWLWISMIHILLFSTRDKEWMIGSGEINNFCQLTRSILEDDIRDVGVIVTLPLFLPMIYTIFWKKNHHWYLWLLLTGVFAYWLWRFYLRYHWCF
ncbi:TPA: YjeO family protein [Citrobacter farmeri]|nr:YjeO family protein [Citrobacter farmeri]